MRLIVILLALVVTPPAFGEHKPSAFENGYYRFGVGMSQIEQAGYETFPSLDYSAGWNFQGASFLAGELGISVLGYRRPGVPVRDLLTTLEASALYRFIRSEKIDVYGRLGILYWAWGDPFGWFSTLSDTGFGSTYGMGVRRRFSEHHSFALEWQAYNGVSGGSHSKATISWLYHN